MDFDPGTIVANSVISAVCFGGYHLVKNYFRKKKIVGLLVPIGKTSLCLRLSNNNTFLLDIDEYCKVEHAQAYEKYKHDHQAYLMHFYPIVGQFVQELLKNFGNKRLVIVSAHENILTQLGIRRIKCFVPDKRLVDQLTGGGDGGVLEISAIRLAFKIGKYKMFSSFDELYSLVKRKLRLKNESL